MKRSMLNFLQSILYCLFSLLLFALPANAATDDTESWEYHLATYAWLAGQNGTVATLPGLPATDINIDFWDDIFGNINGALFLLGEARKDRFGVFMDLAYTDIEMDQSTPGPYFSSVESRTKTWMLSVAGQYRLLDQPKAFLDVIAGLRYWSVDSTLTLGIGLLPEREANNTEDWVDPLVGLKGLSYLGESRFYASGGLAMGGFGAGSDFMWDVSVNLGYQWTETFTTTLGYRYLSVDYEKDDFLYDVSQDGPVLGLSWRF